MCSGYLRRPGGYHGVLATSTPVLGTPRQPHITPMFSPLLGHGRPATDPPDPGHRAWSDDRVRLALADGYTPDGVTSFWTASRDSTVSTTPTGFHTPGGMNSFRTS